MKILLVEDDALICQLLKETIESWQYEVVVINDFTKVMEVFEASEPHLVLMDINLPFYNGYHWCTEIRKQSQVPILFISSRSDKMDLIMVIQLGADDFIQKPIDTQVLMAKIQALLRRVYDFQVDSNQLNYGPLKLSIGQAILQYQDQVVDLTSTELNIMTTLFKKQAIFVRRQLIMENCWLSDDYIDDNTLSINISRLRKKFKEIGLANVIETKKNYGYRIHLEEL